MRKIVVLALLAWALAVGDIGVISIDPQPAVTDRGSAVRQNCSRLLR